MPWSEILFGILLFTAAFLYSSVGHGGASGYLAIMALYNFAPDQMKPIALCMNLFVSLIAFIQFYRAGYFVWKLFWPLAIISIPMAFIGGSIHIQEHVYKTILGAVLLLIVIRFIFLKPPPASTDIKQISQPLLILLGGTIGFLSGMLGIGGGVLLSPVIIMLHWAGQKQAAAVSALFIFVNSFAGLSGQLVKQHGNFAFGTNMYWYILIGIVGSVTGSYLGAKKLNITALKYLLSAVLLIAAVKLIQT